MPSVPKRLVVIEAAVPTGETCDGCEFLELLSEVAFCAEGELPGYPERYVAGSPLRSHECKARDRNLGVSPGSPVGELLRELVRLDSHRSTQFNLHLPVMVEAASDPAVKAWVKGLAQ